MVAHHPTPPKDPAPGPSPRIPWLDDSGPTPAPDLGTGLGPSALTAFRRAVERRLHWAAEAAVLNAIASRFAPWEVIAEPASSGVMPLVAAAGVCTGWKILVSIPHGYRWLRAHRPFQVEVRLSFGRRQQD
ncbi:hypothetical protein [Nocardia sp. NPDC050435]|uniref:hypothetical protein n=1 Tax=Nocardia sp. NPDC050435 TaxID=3155040 RepID=UPI0033E5F82A